MTAVAEAIARVDAGANSEWKAAADSAIATLAKTHRTFNSDDIWDALFTAGVDTHEHRAMGPRILSAVKKKLIKLSNCDTCGTNKVMVSSNREEAHSMDIAVYTSLVYKK